VNTISIITICFNNIEELQKTCATVDNQKTLPFEHIIIDGSTKPEIKNWLENSLQPVYRKWICEKDNGISDAFNKGIKKAGGEIINLLNSGDTLFDENSLSKVSSAFEMNPRISWCHGKLYIHRGGQWVSIGKPFDPKKLYRGMRGVSHPTMYVKKELYDKHGLYDMHLKIAMDYDFLCRIADEKFFFIDVTLVSFDPSGISSNRYLSAMQECFVSYRKYFGFSFKQKLWGWRLTLLYYLLKSPFGRWLYKLKVKMGWENK
jgi:glycosyltransferase involved in cell wall biosynthesis